ncbi:MAG: hypothetical protein ABI539_05810 [Acidobacteriota bacterium]
MGVLMVLLTIGGLIGAALLFAIAWLNESTWLKKFVLGGVAIWFAFYIAMLLGASLLSEERLIEIGDIDGKAFCGFYLDCHLHAAVTDVRKAKTIGNKTANGEFYLVSVKVFSDAKAATLGLLTVHAHVVDAAGLTYTRDEMAEAQLTPQPEFEQTIGPGESFKKEIVFDLPNGVELPRLDVREGYGIDHVIESFLIGDEDSVFHKRAFFKISERTDIAGVE